jgi:hypothetical protein
MYYLNIKVDIIICGGVFVCKKMRRNENPTREKV